MAGPASPRHSPAVADEEQSASPPSPSPKSVPQRELSSNAAADDAAPTMSTANSRFCILLHWDDRAAMYPALLCYYAGSACDCPRTYEYDHPATSRGASREPRAAAEPFVRSCAGMTWKEISGRRRYKTQRRPAYNTAPRPHPSAPTSQRHLPLTTRVRLRARCEYLAAEACQFRRIINLPACARALLQVSRWQL